VTLNRLPTYLSGYRPIQLRRPAIVGLSVVLVWAILGTSAAAQEEEPSYSGDFFSRSTLTGDWGGSRNDLAAKGLTFDANVTQIEQGVVSGGKDSSWKYGGRGDLTFHLDTQKLGLWPGGFLTMELEGDWSQGINGSTGALVPVNTNQLFPLPGGGNVAVPAWNFTQFLSHYAGVTFGKQEFSGADMNEFAHGKGDTQFFNLGFNLNPAALTVPYSSLAAGVVVLPTADPNKAIVSLLVVSATGKASTVGFDELDGPLLAGEGRVRTDFFGLTGHQLVGTYYSWKTYTSVDQRLDLDVIENRKLAAHNGTWGMYYNFDQYIYQPDTEKDQGVGLFGRFGATAGDPIPIQYFYSIGVGAKGPFESRPFDQCGIGYYYSSINNPSLQLPFTTRKFLQDEWGFEAYYNIALTRWLLLTPDIQVVEGAQKNQMLNLREGETKPIDTAVVLGLRARIVF
jgi:porin